MRLVKIFLSALCILVTGLITTSCANSHVSGSVSYSMGVGYGYPMYYGARPYYRSNVVVVRPPHQRPRPVRRR